MGPPAGRSRESSTATALPAALLIFTKATTALTGPYDEVMLPRGSRKAHWEVELAVIIGRKAQYVGEEHALDYVVRYAVINDVSEREFERKRDGQFVEGKICDAFAPLCRWLVTKDEVPDPQAPPHLARTQRRAPTGRHDPECQWRSKKGPPRRCKKGPLGGCGLVPVVHGRAPRATRRALNRLTRRRAREGPVGPRGQAWAGWSVQLAVGV